MEYPLFFIALGLSYLTLLITAPTIIQAEAGNLIFHDGWISLIVLFTLQFIFTTKMKLRENEVILPLMPFICLMLMGLLTVNVDGSIYFYLAMIFFVLAMNYKDLSNGKKLPTLCILTVVMLIIGKVLFRLSDISPTSSFAYSFEAMLIFFTIFFTYLNYRYCKDALVKDCSTYKISPILLSLFLLCFATNPTLSLGYFLIPIILLIASYERDDVLTFNLSYLILTYIIFRDISGRGVYYEVFIVSSLVLFFFALLYEIKDRKLMAITTASISSIMFMASIAITYREDIITTLAWAGFGILSIIVGLKSNTYYFRWIGLFSLLISILKAFTIDISVLSFEMRILSFAALGFALLVISYIYTRYKSKILESLGLKEQTKESQNNQYPPHRPPPGE